MVHADDSFRATMHVASDVYGPSAQSINEYQERAYLPTTEAAPTRDFTRSAQAFDNGSVAATTSVASEERKIAELNAPKAPIVKRDKTTIALPGTKPPRVGVNIEWVQKGVGWDCREVYYVGKKRHRRHIGHIGRQKWEDMQSQFQGADLERVLSEWIEDRRAEKSLSINQDKASE